ncbi:TonB-dependent receptor [Novosphingobium sp. PASSN1]|uniref:TonB-dependent receptor n=1 Tax=Novosphingobium sp. PASSN1 TaxID=2015561 RepID=UPI000BD872FA|nr:TonB-dependent receptor [Novosphingobium sp. PASSN1]OYU35251.1 MAG: TonB-dependent receptor [Novosphingobium sp. PASSN1]
MVRSQFSARIVTKSRRAALGLLMASAAVAATPALAQEAAQPATQATEGLADIVVTATRSSESLSKVAASVSAVSAADLGVGGVKDVQSLATAIPNLSVGDQFGVNRIFIRGIGLTSIDLGADGGVAFLQDGAQIARPAAQLSGFYDLERVEVLRGPQGTLYGRGATAGAINLITKKPTADLDGYIRASYGNYNAATVEGAIGGSISESGKVMIRLAGKYDRRDGYGINEFTGQDIDNRDAYAFRGTLLFKPVEDLSVTLSGEYFNENDSNYAFHYFGPTVRPENFLGSLIGGKSLFTVAAAAGKKANIRNIWSDQEPLNKRDGYSFTGTINWTPGDWDVKSITSYHKFTRFNRDDLDASDANMFGQNNYDERSKTFSQEFVGSYKSEKFDALIGANYFHEELFGSVRVPLINLGILFGLPANTFNAANYLQFGTVKINAYGVYAQGSYAVSDKLKITAGGRFSHEKREGVGTFDFLGGVSTDKAKSWNAFTPTVTLNYQANDATLVYASVTRGFKSGVINVGSRNDVINPEYVWSYELGLKTATADRKLQANLAAFYMDYSDLQVGFVDATSVVTTVNAASARNYGVEAELRAKPLPGLTLELFGTYLNAKYRKFVTGDYRQAFKQISVAGNRLQNAPEFSFRAGADYDIPVGSAGKLNARAEVNWQDRVFFTEFNNADATQAPYALINAGLRFTSANDKWSVDVWGRNLANKLVITNNIITAPLFSSVRVGSVAPPRTYGVTFGLNFR